MTQRVVRLLIALGVVGGALAIAVYVAIGSQAKDPDDPPEDHLECDLPVASGALNNAKLLKLPSIPGISSASGIAFWPDASTSEKKVFVVVDDHEAAGLFRVTLTYTPTEPKVELSKIPLNKDIHNAEGITYLGKNRFAVVEERRQRALVFALPLEEGQEADARCTTNPLDGGRFRDLCRDNQRKGDPLHYICNAGLEGISYDGLSRLFFVQEKNPKRLFYVDAAPLSVCGPEGAKREKDISFPEIIEKTWASSSKMLSDLSDLLALPNGRLLLLSQECEALIEVDPAGEAYSALQLYPADLAQVEGVTWDGENRIYLVGEGLNEATSSAFYELVLSAPIAEPPEPTNLATSMPASGPTPKKKKD